MAVLGGKVYVLGGFDGIQRINSVETYDCFHNCWSEVKHTCTFNESGNKTKKDDYQVLVRRQMVISHMIPQMFLGLGFFKTGISM